MPNTAPEAPRLTMFLGCKRTDAILDPAVQHSVCGKTGYKKMHSDNIRQPFTALSNLQCNTAAIQLQERDLIAMDASLNTQRKANPRSYQLHKVCMLPRPQTFLPVQEWNVRENYTIGADTDAQPTSGLYVEHIICRGT